MAWLQKHGGMWWVGYRLNGKQIRQSTKTDDKTEAEKELLKVQTMFEHHRAGSLTEQLYQALTGKGIPAVTLKAEIEGWLAECEHNTAANTYGRYKAVADDFRAFLSATDKGPMLSAVTTADVTKFLIEKRNNTAASTVNVTRKILAGFFKRGCPRQPAARESSLTRQTVQGATRRKGEAPRVHP